MRDIRIGHGYDVHQLTEGRKLILGGVDIPHHKGALGHSDADVLLHSICDALLGALALGDIGKHFPDTDANFKNIDSRILLEKVCRLVTDKGYLISNIDVSLCLEKPKVLPYADAMKKNIAEITGLTADRISIKATTSEKMGFVGRQEGVFCHCSALLFLP
ncbi:MAG: 2-C-methyl-D-erythritol 2,4-cyclodiphosphate synthase [Bacteroidota bacterium]|jgi:2-C-methyl-D-erythritol 2,4-cyclodiphosphate synthase